MKLAIVHEWFNEVGGAEKCVESFLNIWENADVYSLIDFFDEKKRNTILKGKKVNTSFIQRLPKAKEKYRYYLPFFPLAIEQFDLSEYDVIISSSHAVAKGVITNSSQLHICYIHTPIRYAWDLYFQYLRESGLNKGFKSFLARYLLHKIRIWDVISSNRVDFFIANSYYVSRRVKKLYNRDSIVIYPPVDVEKFDVEPKKDEYYLVVSRLVPYKRVDLIVEAFNRTRERLIVVGSGPDMHKIKSIANKNIEILGYVDDKELVELMKKAKAFVYAAEEDFGISIVEAQACGTPVICYGRGGAVETVIDSVTGLYFMEQSVDSILDALKTFNKIEGKFDPHTIRRNANKFSKKRFEEEIRDFVKSKWNSFKENK